MIIWALIDYENVSDFTHIDLASYERVLVFCGPRHKHLKIDSLPVSAFWNFEILRIPTTGKNNLDFHLAFHLGVLHQKASPDIGFHIIRTEPQIKDALKPAESDELPF